MGITAWEKEDKDTYFRVVNYSGFIYLAEVDSDGEMLPYGRIAQITQGGLKMCADYRGSLPVTPEICQVKVIH